MKFSYQWLTSMVNTGWDLDTTCAKLNELGLEVEEVTPVSAEFSGIVIGKVLTVAPHPDADKLRVTTVDVGRDAPVQIVCGAANVREGMFAPTALVGAVLPNIAIKEAKLRGVESFGMLCSAGELGLEGIPAEGLWDLPTDLTIGMDIREALDLNDYSIEVSLTPNRADALSVLGIARDLSALSGAELTPPTADAFNASISTNHDIQILANEACPSYLGCVVEMSAEAKTPLWMQERLRRSGLRSLGLWVDVTNYILLELGQPMHAFDLSKLQGAIQVRYTKADEALTLLDGKQVSLQEDMLVIADDRGAIALAGVMGGADTAVDDNTTKVFLECAHFTPDAVVGRARRLGLHTDSSHRFERGVDPLLPNLAMNRALGLLVSLGQAKVSPLLGSAQQTFTATPITLRKTRIERLLGVAIADDQVVQLLTGLGMLVEAIADGWQVTAPSWRFDMAIEADLIEELARMYGLDNLPKLPLSATDIAPASRNQSTQQLKKLLVSKGYQEAITYSFVDAKEQALVEPEIQGINLANPIAETLGQMRVSLWTGLLSAVRYNLNRQMKRVRLFETGLRFLPEYDEHQLPTQIQTLAGVACGSANEVQWSSAVRPVDFYDVKGDLEALFNLAGIRHEIEFKAQTHPALHPGQSAGIYYQQKQIGWLGNLHPSLANQLDIDTNVVLFSVDLQPLSNAPAKSAFAGLSKFPLVKRDIALVVDQMVSYEQLHDLALMVKREWYLGVSLFDVYAGKGLAEGQKSLAMSLYFQDLQRTLTDQEIEQCVTEVVTNIAKETGAQLRT